MFSEILNLTKHSSHCFRSYDPAVWSKSFTFTPACVSYPDSSIKLPVFGICKCWEGGNFFLWHLLRDDPCI